MKGNEVVERSFDHGLYGTIKSTSPGSGLFPWGCNPRL